VNTVTSTKIVEESCDMLEGLTNNVLTVCDDEIFAVKMNSRFRQAAQQCFN